MTMIFIIVLFLLLVPGLIRTLFKLGVAIVMAGALVLCYFTLDVSRFNQLVIGLIILVAAGHALTYLIGARRR